MGVESSREEGRPGNTAENDAKPTPSPRSLSDLVVAKTGTPAILNARRGHDSGDRSGGHGNSDRRKPSDKQGGTNKASKTPALDSFCRDVTIEAREGRVDPVIGRDAEIERMVQVLMRRSKSNPVLAGSIT